MVTLALLGLCLWALRRGFDISDEGFYLLNYTYPVEYTASFSSFHLLVDKILPAKSVSVLGYRVASLAFALAEASVFSWAFRRWSAARFGCQLPWAWVLPLFIVSCCMQYSIFPRALNYNSLNSLAIAVLASSVLCYLTAPTARLSLGLLGVGGLAIGLDGFVKLSSAGAALGSAGLVLLLAPAAQVRWWPRVRPLLALALGLLLSVAVFALLVKSLPVWYADLRHETIILLKGSYSPGLLARYLTDAYPVVRTLLYPFGVVAAVAGGWLYYQGRGINRRWQHLAMLAGVGALLVFESARTSLFYITHFNHNRSAVWPLAGLLLGAALLAAARLRYGGAGPTAGSWRAWVVPLWLLALPLASALGTVNNIFINVLLELMYWQAVLLILYQLLPAPAQQLLGVRLALLAAPVVAMTEQTVCGLGWQPYLQVENMWHQQTPITIGPPASSASLLVDAPTAQYLRELRTALHVAGFRPGDPMLALYDTPGLVYAVGGKSPGNAWYFSRQDARNCDALSKTHLDLRRAFMLVDEPPGPDFVACLAEHGLHFPADYQLVHQSVNPYSRSQYHWHDQQDTVRVYAPRLYAPVVAGASAARRPNL